MWGWSSRAVMPNLAQKSLGTDDRRELGAQDLDRDLAVVLQVVSQVHRGHAALAQLAFEVVAVGQGGGEAVWRGVLHA